MANPVHDYGSPAQEVREGAAHGDLWARDDIQFPRLLAEINAVELTRGQVNDLCEAMDVTPEQLGELFERADQAWERIKRRTIKP